MTTALHPAGMKAPLIVPVRPLCKLCRRPVWEDADEHGKIVNWGCEAGSPGALSRRGMKKNDLKLGDTLIVDGYRAKDGSNLIDARRVTFSDGRSVYGGSQGDGGPGDGQGQ